MNFGTQSEPRSCLDVYLGPVCSTQLKLMFWGSDIYGVRCTYGVLFTWCNLKWILDSQNVHMASKIFFLEYTSYLDILIMILMVVITVGLAKKLWKCQIYIVVFQWKEWWTHSTSLLLLGSLCTMPSVIELHVW